MVATGFGSPAHDEEEAARSVPIKQARTALSGAISIALVLASATPALGAEAQTSADEVPAKVESEIDWYRVGDLAVDTAVLRPLGALSTIGGFVFFLASVPFVAPAGRIETAWDIFVYGSYDDTFVRPLGEL